MDSNWDVPILVGKLMKSTFQWVQPHIYAAYKSGVVLVFVPTPFSVLVLRHPILDEWPMYQVESIRDASYGWRTTLAPFGRPPLYLFASRPVMNNWVLSR